MVFIIISFVVAYFFAMNIGASGAAASMGVVYGAGAIPKKRIALIICGVGVFVGAASGGGEVVKTIGQGIIPQDLMTAQIVVIILAASTLSLFIANVLGIPLSTSEVTVGSVVGVGIAFQSLFFKELLLVVTFWLFVPLISFLFSYMGGMLLKKFQSICLSLQKGKWKKILIVFLILAGFWEAFSAGMNNVGNAIGPLVGAGLIDISTGTITGGIFVAIGAILFGGRVLETNGKEITNLSLLEGIMVSFTSALLVIIASLLGIPMPLTQVTTSAIVGIGSAQTGISIWQKAIIARIIKVWIVSPIISLIISFGLVKLLLIRDFYSVFIIGSVAIATIGIVSLVKTIKLEKQTTHEQGGGI